MMTAAAAALIWAGELAAFVLGIYLSAKALKYPAYFPRVFRLLERWSGFNIGEKP
jgi:hypothetical protein